MNRCISKWLVIMFTLICVVFKEQTYVMKVVVNLTDPRPKLVNIVCPDSHFDMHG